MVVLTSVTWFKLAMPPPALAELPASVLLVTVNPPSSNSL